MWNNPLVVMELLRINQLEIARDAETGRVARSARRASRRHRIAAERRREPRTTPVPVNCSNV